MKDIVIYGAGGLAQEVLWTIHMINGSGGKRFNVIGFVSELESDYQTRREFEGLPIFAPDAVGKIKYAACGIADPFLKYRVVNTYKHEWPNILNPEVMKTTNDHIDGVGIYLAAKVCLMPHSKIKSFVYINVQSVIGHDTVVNKYVSMSPLVGIMGNNVIGSLTYVGVGAVSREKINIGSCCVIGAGASVVSDIPDYTMVGGVPARVIKQLEQKELICENIICG